MRKKPVRKKSLSRKKKTAKRRVSARRPKAPVRRKSVRKPTVTKVKKPLLEPVGQITHYFPHVKAGVVKVKKGDIRLGDTIHIKGHTTDFKQKVTSLQFDHQPIQKATKGQEVGLQVKSRVRQNDLVFKP